MTTTLTTRITTTGGIVIGADDGHIYVEAQDPNPVDVDAVHALLGQLGYAPTTDDPMDDDSTIDGGTRVWYASHR